MKLIYAFIFTISSTTLAFPQSDPINQQSDNIFDPINQQSDNIFDPIKNPVSLFKKASALVPKMIFPYKLLAENYADEKGYLVVRDTKAKNYFVVSDKAKDKLWSNDLDRIGYIVYNATSLFVRKNGTVSEGHSVALKRYAEATCVNTEFPISMELNRVRGKYLDTGDLIKIDTGKKGCFLPMKLLNDGTTFINFIVTGNGPGSGKNASSSIVELLQSIEMELNNFYKFFNRCILSLDRVRIYDSNNNYKISFIGVGKKKRTAGLSVKSKNRLNIEMFALCMFDLKRSSTMKKIFIGRRWPDIVVDSDFDDLFKEICVKRYNYGLE